MTIETTTRFKCNFCGRETRDKLEYDSRWWAVGISQQISNQQHEFDACPDCLPMPLQTSKAKAILRAIADKFRGGAKKK